MTPDKFVKFGETFLTRKPFFIIVESRKRLLKRGVGGNAPQRGKLISWKVSREQKC